jgi:GNAT superfamily N-acetyltransferase
MALPDQSWHIRTAREDDIPALHALVEASVRGLQVNDYTPAQIEGALGTVLGLDTQLIRDHTYFLAEISPEGSKDRKLAGCGGWSRRKTLFGADRSPGREPDMLDPEIDAAKVRAIFIHPAFARRGLGSLILAHVEAAAQAAGFRHFEMGFHPDRRPALPPQRLRRSRAHRGPTPKRRDTARHQDGEIVRFRHRVKQLRG